MKKNSGFTLIEILIAIGLFLILSLGIYFTYANLLDVVGRTRMHTLATSVLNKEIEIVRNLPYDSVGIVGGSPPGQIAGSKTVGYEGQIFVINAYVRNIDDPFDGTIGGSPNDTAPADHKLVEIRVDCQTCFKFVPLGFTTWVSPQNLEASTMNGSLFINVFNASGVAVSNADVLVKNTALSPDITINDATDNNGMLQLVDIPTSTNAYQITVTKSGYTSAKTYTSGLSANPNPVQPHATVASQTVTDISFAIDRVSTINVTSQDYLCRAVPSVTFMQTGGRLIGASPNVPVYSASSTTDTEGQVAVSNLGWDTFSFTNLSSNYDLSGTIPLAPLTINPNTTTAFALVLDAKASTSLLATAVDSAGLPVADVSVNLVKSGFNETKLTGERFYTETAWPSGAYLAQDGNLDDASPADDIGLLQTGGVYPTSTNSYLVSNTIDVGSAATVWRSIAWTGNTPGNTSLKFQLASSGGSGSYSYVGPDNTSGTYYTASSTIGSMHNGKQYLRYKAYFNTTDETVTPTLSDLSVGFSSGCIPAGQTLWSGIANGTYNVIASKSGYETASSSVIVSSGWQEIRLIMQ